MERPRTKGRTADLLELVLLRCLVFACFCGLSVELFGSKLGLEVNGLVPWQAELKDVRTFKLNSD